MSFTILLIVSYIFLGAFVCFSGLPSIFFLFFIIPLELVCVRPSTYLNQLWEPTSHPVHPVFLIHSNNTCGMHFPSLSVLDLCSQSHQIFVNKHDHWCTHFFGNEKSACFLGQSQLVPSAMAERKSQSITLNLLYPYWDAPISHTFKNEKEVAAFLKQPPQFLREPNGPNTWTNKAIRQNDVKQVNPNVIYDIIGSGCLIAKRACHTSRSGIKFSKQKQLLR